MKRVDVVLSGVGGQGILTLAALMGTAAIIDGYDVRVSEVHGMAQRGGQVVCHVKIGERVSSPLVMEGSADMVVSLSCFTKMPCDFKSSIILLRASSTVSPR